MTRPSSQLRPTLILKFPLSSQFGGGERHALAVFEEIARRGGRFFLVGSCPVLLREFRSRGWPALRWWAGTEPVTPWALALFPITAPLAFLGLASVVLAMRIVRGTRTVYCLSLTEKILISPVARTLGMRVVWAEVVPIGRWLTQSPLRLPFRWWGRFCTVFALSRFVGDQIAALGVPRARIAVVHAGVDLAAFASPPRAAPRHAERFVVGTVARLDPEKGIATLVRAVRRLRVAVPHAQLLVVGDGPQRADLEQLARAIGIAPAVTFAGFQADVAPWLQQMDCFVLPSEKREAFGIVLIEAMATACPVVASDLGGIGEVVEHGVTGFLVEPANEGLLAQALLHVYRNPEVAAAMGARGQARVRERFALETMLDRMTALLT
jgi:glycosyltransferase involved in cell wall biosynthesis